MNNQELRERALKYAKSIVKGNFHNSPNFGQVRQELMTMFQLTENEAQDITTQAFTGGN